MSTETTNKKIKIDNGTTFGKTYTDKAIDAKLPTDLIASANKLSLGVGNAPLGNGVNLSGFTYDEATKTLKASGSGGIEIKEFEINMATKEVAITNDDIYSSLISPFILAIYANISDGETTSKQYLYATLCNYMNSSSDGGRIIYLLGYAGINPFTGETLNNSVCRLKLNDTLDKAVFEIVEGTSGGSQLDYLYFNLVEDDEGNSMFTYTLEQYNEMIAKKPIIFNDKGFYYNAVADKNNDTNNYEITLTKIANIGPEISYANATLVLHGVLSSTSLKTTLSLVKGEIINYQVSTNSSTNNSYLDITYVNALTNEQAIGTLMPDYTHGNNNQVMTIVNGYPEWADVNSKTISLFGKHSILVPKDSADTAIDLYIHNIVLKDNAETTTKKIYLTIQSTTNTPATTKELLQTLLGSTSRYIRVSGYTPTNDISAINWTGTFDTSKYDVRGTETSLTDFTVIEDSVVTLK